MSTKHDLVGKRFGTLTALTYETGPRGRGKWLCQCECGNMTRVNTGNLMKAKFGCKKCADLKMGQVRRIDMTGYIFGELIVKEYSHKGIWLCECSCGSKYEARGANLRSGRTTKCYACSRQTGGDKLKKHAFADMPLTYWYGLVNGASKRNIKFEITAEQAYCGFVNQNGKCALSGLPIGFRDQVGRKQTASLDRIDSSKGYVEDNIQWVHKDVNRMKNDFSQEYFLHMCQEITEYANRQTQNSGIDFPS